MTGEDAVAWSLARLNTARHQPALPHHHGHWQIASRIADELLAPAAG